MGALIGLEREHRRDQVQVIAGVRTFPLFSIAGYLLAIVAQGAADSGALLLAAGFAGVIALAIAFLLVRHQLGVTGMTTPMAMVVTFLLGVLIGYGHSQEAIVVGVAVTFLLLTKERLHTFAEVLNDQEILGALQFITVVFILFPIVRNLRAPVLGQNWIGRGALVDPYATLLIVIFVSSISFASFVAMRFVGASRGVAVTGLLGGLVSSEATTVSLAEQAREAPELMRHAVTGALLATITMLARNVAIAAFADPSLAMTRAMLPALAPMALATAGFAWYRWLVARRAAGKDGASRPAAVRNPFALWPAFKFALLFLAVTVIASVLSARLGPVGVYATAVGALVSAGAVIGSVATLYAHGAITLQTAVITGVLACVVGVANKLVILRATNADVYARARVPLAAVTLVGLAALAGVALAFL